MLAGALQEACWAPGGTPRLNGHWGARGLPCMMPARCIAAVAKLCAHWPIFALPRPCATRRSGPVRRHLPRHPVFPGSLCGPGPNVAVHAALAACTSRLRRGSTHSERPAPAVAAGQRGGSSLRQPAAPAAPWIGAGGTAPGAAAVPPGLWIPVGALQAACRSLLGPSAFRCARLTMCALPNCLLVLCFQKLLLSVKCPMVWIRFNLQCSFRLTFLSMTTGGCCGF